MHPKPKKLNNVVIVGLSGMGKSSLVNMLCPGAKAPTSNDALGCTQKEAQYTCDLGNEQKCIVHDTVGIHEGGSSFMNLLRNIFRSTPTEPTEVERYLGTMKGRGDLHLLVYCMSGQRYNFKKSSQRKNYRKIRSVAGAGVPIVVVTTGLEGCDHLQRERWWSENAGQKLDMDSRPEYHSCVSTLPRNELGTSNRALYDESCNAVKKLIRDRLK